MSDNPISSPNEVSTKSTFEDWRQITNQIIKRLNSLYSESGENGSPDDNLHVWNDATIGTSGFGTLTVTGNVEVGKDLIIENDLIVKGSTTTVNTVDLIVKDRMVELNHDPFYRNHPYNDKLKSGLQVHVGIDSGNIIVSYENDWPEALGLFKNQVTSIEYQISEGEDYEIDKDKTDLIMGTDEPEVTLIFDSFSLQKTGDPLDKFVVGDKIKGHTSGAEAVIKSIVQQNSDFDVEIRINYLESVSERDSVFEIGEYVFDPNETQENIDAALAYMQQWNSEGSKVQTVQNNQSLSSLDLSNKKYVLRFKDINGQVDNKMFLVDTYDIDTKKLTIVGDASEYKTQHQYLIDLDFQIQEIKTQKFYWDEATKKWTFDYDLNVLGDIYSNGKTLWKIVPNQDSQIYYNGNVAVGKTVGDYTSPLAKLHIVSDTDDLIRLNDWKFSKSNDDLKLSFNTNNLTFKSDNADNIILDSNGSIKLSNGVIRNSGGSLTSPSYTFHNDPDTGISLGYGLNFSVDGENVFRVTKPDVNNTTTDGAVIEKGGLVIRPSLVDPSTPIEGLIRYNQSTKDFEGYRGINPNGTGDWYSFTSSNDSGGAYTVYSKSDTIPNLSDYSDSNIDQYYWYTKLTIPAPTQTADDIYQGKSQGGDVFCDFYSFDFYGYIKNRILNNNYPSGSDDERGYGTTDSEVFHYKFYVERDFNVIDNSGTKEVVLNTDIKVKKIEGINVDDKTLQGFQFWFVNTNNDETEIYFRYPIGDSGIEIVDNSILSQDFEKLETTWFSEIHGYESTYQNNWPPTGVHQDDDYINIGQMSLWETASTDRNKIYYNGGPTGFVGIGLDNPLAKLHVDGTIRTSNLTGDTVLVSNSLKDIVSSSITIDELSSVSANKWLSTPNNIDIYRNTKVGVGDFSGTNLVEKLEVDGNIKSTGYISLPEGVGSGIKFKVDVNGTETDKASIYYLNSTENLILKSENVNPTGLIIGNEKLLLNYDTNTYEVLHEGNFTTLKTGYVENGQNYPVEEDNNGKMFVNVPWVDTDTNTTYTAGEGLSLVGTEFSLDPATSQTLGGIKLTTSPETEVWSHPHYAVKLDSDSRAYVTVPWTDKWADAHATSGIYRDSKIGIGDFSATALTDTLELRSTSGDNYLKIKSTSESTTDLCGIKLERKCLNANNNWIDSDYVLLFSDNGDLRLRQDNTTIYRYDYTDHEHIFEDKVKVNSSITATGRITCDEGVIGDFTGVTLTSPASAPLQVSGGVIQNNPAFRVWGPTSSTDSTLMSNLTIRADGSLAASQSIGLYGTEDNDVYIKVESNSNNDDFLSCGIKFYNEPTVSGTQKAPVNFKLENSYVDADDGEDYSSFNLNAFFENDSNVIVEYPAYSLISKNPSTSDMTHKFFYKLDVIGGITASGNIESTSDIRIKENLEIIENPIDKIKELNGYTYNKNGEEKRSAGLVAQEVEKVLPEVVSENSDGIKSLAYGNIVALLVETVKEQQKQIDELKKQISDK